MKTNVYFGWMRQRLNKRFCLITSSFCVIAAISIGLYFLITQINSNEIDTIDDWTPETAKWVDNEEIQIFRKYLRFKTISLESDFEPCVAFLKKLARDLNLEVSVHYPSNKQNPVVLMTWQGSQPELPSILLNSHMDVVPVYEEFWIHPPFAAKIDANGNIHARGTQDMKSVGMQYLAAIRALKRKGIDRLKRTVHLTYVPDEEAGGKLGLKAFVYTRDFKNLNVGCALDEGYPSPNQDLEVFNTERTGWSINVTAHGHSGHASILFEDTAAAKINYIINKFLEFRQIEAKKVNELKYKYGNVTSVNLTIMKGGIKDNVVPAEMNAFFDMRLSVNTDWNELENTIQRWIKEAGEGVTININKGIRAEPTPVDKSNPYWIAFKSATEQLQLNVTPSVFRAATDSRYLRQLKIPAFGFSPIMNTSPMLHEHNEYIHADTYLKGIEIYETIIEKMADME